MKKMSTKDLISINQLCIDDLNNIFKLSTKLKKMKRAGTHHQLLRGKKLGMIFGKSSTRTRVSFQTGIFDLGGIGLFLNSSDLQIGRGEEIKDTAHVLSRYIDGIMIRTYDHKEVEELAGFSSIPVINGLTDLLHPCQVLSDVFTIMENKNGYLDDMKIVFVGDGNNVANSWLYAAMKLDLNLFIASPKGYEVNNRVLEESQKGIKSGKIIITNNPAEAAEDADVIYTDVWASMGQESEMEKRKKIFSPFQVNTELISKSKPDVSIMHCLPAHRGEEITAEVLDGKNSIIFEQAENRLHVQKAIMAMLMR